MGERSLLEAEALDAIRDVYRFTWTLPYVDSGVYKSLSVGVRDGWTLYREMFYVCHTLYLVVL